MKNLLATLVILFGGTVMAAENFYSFQAKAPGGKTVAMSEYKDKVVLVVNVASKCGFTKQYEGLESLYKKYKDKGLVIVGFPCNQFGQQEPGNDEEIQKFCKLTYSVDFPVMSKVNVNGSDADPIYKYLKSAKPGVLGTEDIKWNFTKFLINKQGEPIHRYAPQTTPEDLEKDVIAALESTK